MIRFIAVLVLCAVPQISLGMERAVKPEVILEPAEVGQGEILMVTVKGASGRVQGSINGNPVHFYPSKDSQKAMVGIDLYTEPGLYELKLLIDGTAVSKTVAVNRKKYELQRLTLRKDMVELSPENAARVAKEAARLRAIWPVETPRVWDGNFVNPLEGRIVSSFGLRRIINNIPKSSHSGVDVAGPEGAEVRAPGDGVVHFIDDLFYSGNSIILDHGQGLYTMYFHLSRIVVEKGQKVKKGEVIALVGSTGRSTGPHLHWGVRMQGARVDPLKLLEMKLD